MSITIVNRWRFREDGKIDEGLAAAAELVDYFKTTEREVRLSLWLQDRNDPLWFFHVTVFDSYEAYVKVRQSAAIKRFVERLYPQIDRASHTAPECDVVLSTGATLSAVDVRRTQSKHR